jgi:hypothetical protein
MVSKKTVLLGGLLTVLIGSFSVDTMAADYGKGNSCRRGDRLNIQDLDMSPDPLFEGQRVRAWKVRIRFDGRRDCDTDIVVREGNTIAGNVRDFKLRPGVNEIEIPVAEGFRLRGREHCFNVQVDLDGSRQQIDADRRFCASQRSAWSMREPDDRRRSDR